MVPIYEYEPRAETLITIAGIDCDFEKTLSAGSLFLRSQKV